MAVCSLSFLYFYSFVLFVLRAIAFNEEHPSSPSSHERYVYRLMVRECLDAPSGISCCAGDLLLAAVDAQPCSRALSYNQIMPSGRETCTSRRAAPVQPLLSHSLSLSLSHISLFIKDFFLLFTHIFLLSSLLSFDFSVRIFTFRRHLRLGGCYLLTKAESSLAGAPYRAPSSRYYIACGIVCVIGSRLVSRCDV